MIQLIFLELPQIVCEKSAFEKSVLCIFDCEKSAFTNLEFRKEVPNFDVMENAILRRRSKPLAPLKALLLINAQLIAIITVPIPPPLLLPNIPPLTATMIN